MLQWKSNNVTCFESVFVALGIQCEMRMRHVIICGFFDSTLVWNISHSKKNWARYDQKCVLIFMWSTRHSCQILIELEFSGQIFGLESNIKTYEVPSVGAELFHADRWTDMTKPTVAFRNFANAPKMYFFSVSVVFSNADLKENGEVVKFSYPTRLPICTTSTFVKVMCVYCGWVLLDRI